MVYYIESINQASKQASNQSIKTINRSIESSTSRHPEQSAASLPIFKGIVFVLYLYCILFVVSDFAVFALYCNVLYCIMFLMLHCVYFSVHSQRILCRADAEVGSLCREICKRASGRNIVSVDRGCISRLRNINQIFILCARTH